MKYLLTTIVIFLLSSSVKINGCTSFASYGTRPIYGMNFDYPQTSLTLTIETEGITDYFRIRFDGNLDVVGVNDKGIFTNAQMQYPHQIGVSNPGPLDIFFSELFIISLTSFNGAGYIREFLTESQRLLRQYPQITLHEMIAGPQQAFVAESGDTVNHVTDMENNMLVMSNFPLYKFAGQPYTSVTGVGAARYKTLYEYVRDNNDSFSILKGFEGLSRCRQSGGFATRFSIVCDPDSNNIYISFRNDFNKIWRISLDEKIIETWSGFDFYYSRGIGETGISSEELIEMTSVSGEDLSAPEKFTLQQNYPNPFNPETRISYSIGKTAAIDISIFNMAGEKIITLFNGHRNPGHYHELWNGRDERGYEVSSGIYFCRLRSVKKTITKKMTLLR